MPFFEIIPNINLQQPFGRKYIFMCGNLKQFERILTVLADGKESVIISR
jgi:hypothetical protein